MYMLKDWRMMSSACTELGVVIDLLTTLVFISYKLLYFLLELTSSVGSHYCGLLDVEPITIYKSQFYNATGNLIRG